MLNLLAAGVAAAASTACPALPGIDAVLSRPDLSYIMIGEYHGTVEMPAIAADAACHAAATGRPLVVGVELTPADQPAIDRFLKSKGDAAARKALVATPGWTEPGGRTTTAIVDFLDAARKLARRHRVRVVAFDVAREPSGTSPAREAAMAKALIDAVTKTPRSLAVVLTGVGHADKEGFTSATPPFLAAAGHLPAAATVSLAFRRPGGAYWGCASPTGDEARGCTAYEMTPREPVAPRGIVLDASLRGGFDGLYSPGRAYTASQPAR